MSIRDFSRVALIENSIISPKQSRAIVSLEDKFVTYDDVDTLNDKSIRATKLVYFVKYSVPDKFHNEKKPFIIGTDLLGFKLRVSGPKHFLALGKTLPEVAWMIRNTNFSPTHFTMAKTHVGIQIPFSVNVSEYAKRVYEDAVSRGFDPKNLENGVFVAHRCAMALADKYTKLAPEPRSKIECAGALRKAETLANKKEKAL